MLTNITKPELYALGDLLNQAETDVYAQRASEHVPKLIALLANGMPHPEIVDRVLADHGFPRDSLLARLRSCPITDEADRNTLAGAMIHIASALYHEAVEYTD
ncbi:hypothetical protein HY492_02980 [Candidatus Woesearchaeota archaeon]|nr:hypothetical protein [Candidatus Woesearchaeota archaeon]